MNLRAVAVTLVCALAPQPATFSVTGHPFGIVATADGAAVLVSSDGMGQARSGVEVFARSTGSLTRRRFVAIEGAGAGAALTDDGKTLLVANGTGLAALDVAALEGDGSVAPAYVRDGRAGAIEVVASRDGSYAFVSEERQNRLAVVRISRDPGGSLGLALAGHIELDRAPVGLALSPDGSLLYAVSEVARAGAVPANAGDPGATRTHCSESDGPNGTLSVIDVAKAESGSGDAVVARLAAGCAPVRIALGPKGSVAWVTARGDDALLAFDAPKLVSDAQHALLARVPVGRSPVGIVVVRAGTRVVVADSDRFAGSPTSDADVVDTAKALAHEPAVAGSVTTGSFPRELAESRDHTTIYLTNFRSKTLEAIDESTLP